MIPLRLSVLTLVLSVAAGPGMACKAAKSDGRADPAAAAAPNLPSLVVRDESSGLTFSYITLDGGFQLAKKVADVPYEARDAVRVWSEISGDGIAGPWVYLADLRNKVADGSYKVEVIARTQFEGMAAERRDKSKKGGPKGPVNGAGPVATVDPPANKGGESPGNKKLKVIIYGADWCKPCHMAENYLKSKGVPFEHRDIDNPETNEEMQIKLQDAGIKSHSIPVLDVNGKLLVGFSEAELDKALAAAGG